MWRTLKHMHYVHSCTCGWRALPNIQFRPSGGIHTPSAVAALIGFEAALAVFNTLGLTRQEIGDCIGNTFAVGSYVGKGCDPQNTSIGKLFGIGKMCPKDGRGGERQGCSVREDHHRRCRTQRRGHCANTSLQAIRHCPSADVRRPVSSPGAEAERVLSVPFSNPNYLL